MVKSIQNTVVMMKKSIMKKREFSPPQTLKPLTSRVLMFLIMVHSIGLIITIETQTTL